MKYEISNFVILITSDLRKVISSSNSNRPPAAAAVVVVTYSSLVTTKANTITKPVSNINVCCSVPDYTRNMWLPAVVVHFRNAAQKNR